MLTVNSNDSIKTDETLTKSTRLLLFFASIFLSWKLFRLIHPVELFWNIHNYLIVIFSFISIGISLRNNLYLKKSRIAVLVSMFILLSVSRLAIFPLFDPFFLASLVFCFYFIILKFFMKRTIETGFRYFEFLLILLLIYNVIDYFDANNPLISIFNYEIPLFMEGAMNPLGHQSQSFFSRSMTESFIVRSVGVSGTQYASSALTAATAIYFYILKKHKLFFFSFLLVVLWGVGTSLLAMLACILFIKRKSNISIVISIIGLVVIYLIIANRGWSNSVYFNITNNFEPFNYMMASLFGEGKSNSSLHTEFRILGLLFSLGLIGNFLLIVMIINYIKYALSFRMFDNAYFNAGLGFIAVLLITTAHYNTFFVFSNIFFFVC